MRSASLILYPLISKADVRYLEGLRKKVHVPKALQHDMNDALHRWCQRHRIEPQEWIDEYNAPLYRGDDEILDENNNWTFHFPVFSTPYWKHNLAFLE